MIGISCGKLLEKWGFLFKSKITKRNPCKIKGCND